MSVTERRSRVISPFAKVVLATRIWWLLLYVHYGLRRYELPAFVARLSDRTSSPSRRYEHPVRLGGIVYRVLNVGFLHTRCLIMCLVLFALIRDQGDSPELVIGLPKTPTDRDAHSWIEVDGRPMGPPPGPSDHVELARYS